jgi:hypothetical protein
VTWLPYSRDWRAQAAAQPVELPSRLLTPKIAAEPRVLVEALTASWLHEGRTVEPGRRYAVPASVVADLEARGKAKPVE